MNTALVIVMVALALFGAPLFAVMLGFAMLGASTVGSFLNPVGSPITHMFYGAMVKIWTLASAEESITLSTIPLFTVAGYVMAEAKTANRLVRVAEGFFGWVPGGLAIVAVVACAFFTTFTGASGVTIVAIGGLIFPSLIKGKYPERFSLGLMTGSGSIGLLFPPSLPLIVYGMVYGMTAGQLARDESGGGAALPNFDIGRFLGAGILPGIVLIGIVSLYASYVGVKHKVPRTPFKGKDALKALWEAKWELPIPFFLIYVVATMTMQIPDAAAFTVVYVIIVECLVYRDVPLRKLFPVAREAMTLVGAIFGIIVASTALTDYFVFAEIPQKLNALLAANVSSRWTFLLALNGLLLIVGCLMDIFSAILVVVPLIVLPAAHYGVDPYHLGVIFLLNLEIGYLTPPVGLNLFITAFRFNRPVLDVYKAAVPFILLMVGSLMIVTYVPALTALSLKMGPKARPSISNVDSTPVQGADGDGGVPKGWDSQGAPTEMGVCAASPVLADDRLTCENTVNDRAKCTAMTDTEEQKDCFTELAKEFGSDTEFRYYPFPASKSGCAAMEGQARLDCENYVDEADKCNAMADPDDKATCLEAPRKEYLESLGLAEAAEDDGSGTTDETGDGSGDGDAGTGAAAGADGGL